MDSERGYSEGGAGEREAGERQAGEREAGRRYSASDIADALGQKFAPTIEQAAVIEAPLAPTLVVAGAGAGKTETMAARVVYLIANRLLRPDQVLGLTFTRKAAQQLNARVRQRLRQLERPETLHRLDFDGGLREHLRSGEPEISTYHAYAGRLLGDYGLLLPLEPSARVISETERWQLAYDVVAGWTGEIASSKTPGGITADVLTLSGELAEHLVDEPELLRFDSAIERLVAELPKGKGQRATPNQKLLGIANVAAQRRGLLPLVAELHRRLRENNLIDFGTQMAAAARLSELAVVREAEQGRYRAVLLDEYQDTGYAQRLLLSQLFGRGVPLAVTAVGDPIQSIYGWRGASPANLPRFTADFPNPDGTPAARLELLTSWRNPPEALTLANAASADLRLRGVPVSTLLPRPGAVPGQVRLALHLTQVDEREWVADQVAERWNAVPVPPTTAILVRRNADSVELGAALGKRGIPYEVMGLGGLLHTPEVADVVALLRLVSDPLQGTAAMRLLTGARVQLGAADLRALSRRARDLARGVDESTAAPRESGPGVSGPGESGPGESGPGESGDGSSAAGALAAALDDALPADPAELAGLGDALVDPGPADRYSALGYARIGKLGSEIRRLQARLGGPIIELIADVERVLGLGIETRLRVDRQHGARGNGREHLDAFAEIVSDYVERPGATLPALLAFLAAAEEIERGLPPGEVEVAPDRVQILTVHAAKGLEWEVVAVPHLTAGVFPSGRASSTWMTTAGQLPPNVRGDRVLTPTPGGTGASVRVTDGSDAGVPVFDLHHAHDRKEFEELLGDHAEDLKELGSDEDRRLFYVAATRTERVLLLSGHRFSVGTKKAREPSPFLVEAREHLEAKYGVSEVGRELIDQTGGSIAVDEWVPAPAADADNPLSESAETASWPRDFLGSRRAGLQAAAERVLAHLADPGLDTSGDDSGPGDDPDPEGWAADVDALLAERAATRVPVVLPAELSVSDLVALRRDPEGFAASVRRPLPQRPNPQARRGTAFHAWLERRFGPTRLLDIDELPGALDADTALDPAADTELALLQRRFEASEWADRSPVDVEVPFEFVLGGKIVRGRMDAVFREERPDPAGGSRAGFIVVDWKTGSPPDSTVDAEAVAVQLASYRLAWARLAQVPPERVRAAFFYVRHGLTVAPDRLDDAAELEALVAAAAAEPLR